MDANLVCDTTFNRTVVNSIETVPVTLSATTTTYYDDGKVMGTQDANGKWTMHDYTDAGQVWRTRQFVNVDGTEITGVTITTLLGYDGNGNQKWTLDANAYEAIRANTYTVTVNGSPVTKQLQNMNAGEVAALFATQELGKLTQYSYDQLNRSTRVDLPSTGTSAAFTQSKYDWLGQKWLEIDADNKPTAYVYDGLGRLTLGDYGCEPSHGFAAKPATSRLLLLYMGRQTGRQYRHALYL